MNEIIEEKKKTLVDDKEKIEKENIDNDKTKENLKKK